MKKGKSRVLMAASAVCMLTGLTLLPAAAFANGNGNGAVNGQSAQAGGIGAANGSSNAGGANSAANRSTSTTAATNVPQPFSTADLNNTGANDTSSSNQYLSTRDGSPSLNGSGTGGANGEPCAGCVGKADNKNPPGQYPNGSDHNAGYECDTNHGIGQSNPAHTGCATTTTSTTTTTLPTSPTTPTTAPTTTAPTTAPTTAATIAPRSSDPGTSATGTTVATASAAKAVPVHGSLAFTGAAAAAEALAGLTALGAGAVLVGMARRRRGEDS